MSNNHTQNPSDSLPVIQATYHLFHFEGNLTADVSTGKGIAISLGNNFMVLWPFKLLKVIWPKLLLEKTLDFFKAFT
jgi:hypothetical protein